jgi:hypothetical protein
MSSELGSAIDQQPIAAPARLSPAPRNLVAGRLELHRLAEQEISPARQRVTGKIGLRATPGGFGTPPFGDGEQVRLAGTELVRTSAAGEERRAVAVDAAVTGFLTDWFAFGASVLLELRADSDADGEPSLIQLWPEHFDIAVELGAEAAGTRATYGFSPGDEQHPEPYAYVGPWVTQTGELWHATGFPGAELGYGALVAAEDPRALALAFLAARRDALAGR